MMTEPQPEIYHPTAAEKSQGRWAVVAERLDSNGEEDWNYPIHVIPIFGNEHALSILCWCQPVPDKDNANTLVHNASQ